MFRNTLRLLGKHDFAASSTQCTNSTRYNREPRCLNHACSRESCKAANLVLRRRGRREQEGCRHRGRYGLCWCGGGLLHSRICVILRDPACNLRGERSFGTFGLPREQGAEDGTVCRNPTERTGRYGISFGTKLRSSLGELWCFWGLSVQPQGGKNENTNQLD